MFSDGNKVKSEINKTQRSYNVFEYHTLLTHIKKKIIREIKMKMLKFEIFLKQHLELQKFVSEKPKL